MSRLQDRLAAAKAEDERVAKRHQADETKALERFRSALRDAMKWDYAKVKKSYFRAELRSGSPSCPRLQAPAIAMQIQMVKLDTRKAPFHVSKGSDLFDALMWQPESERAAKTVCD